MTIKKVITPKVEKKSVVTPGKVVPLQRADILSVNFSKFNLDPICLRGKFNNHFKDSQQYNSIVTSLLGKILPKLTLHTYNEICEGTQEGRQLHFHTVDDAHRKIIREILKKYGFADDTIDQMFEGNDILEFSASLGHVYAARIVCHKVGNILYFLFIDTNHHVYLDEKYVRESMFYEDCPIYLDGRCSYMPSECFAVGYLDEEKLRESFEYTVKP